MDKISRIAAVVAALLATGAHAAEGYATWDNFNGATQIDVKRWLEPEERLAIEGGAMRIVKRALGSQYGNSGYHYDSLRNDLANPAPVTRMRAIVTVNAADVMDCGPNISAVQASIGGQFFNAGGGAPTSQTNDVVALLQVQRNNIDSVGVLQISSVVYQCNSGCNSTSTVLGGVYLGSATVGEALTLTLDWDPAANRFGFTRAGSATAYVNYAVSDAQPAYAPARWLGVRMDMANCLAGPRTEGSIDVKFDNLYVNASAVP